MMFRSNIYKFISLNIVLLFMSCSSIPFISKKHNLCIMMRNADHEELNTICQKLLDEGATNIDVLMNCLSDNSELRSPMIRINAPADHCEKYLYFAPKTVADLSLTLLAFILEKWEYNKLENTAAFPIDDSEREKIISEFLEWYNNNYKKEKKPRSKQEENIFSSSQNNLTITHGYLEGFYFGLKEQNDVTGFTKTGSSESGKKYNKISDLEIPKSTMEIDILTCRSATGWVGHEISKKTNAKVYGWDGRLNFDKKTFLPEESFRPSNVFDLMNWNWPGYRKEIK